MTKLVRDAIAKGDRIKENLKKEERAKGSYEEGLVAGTMTFASLMLQVVSGKQIERELFEGFFDGFKRAQREYKDRSRRRS